MSHTDPITKVVLIITQILDIPAEAAASRRLDAHDGWDSLKFIEIVLQVEEEFDVQFDEADIAELTNAERIVAAVELLKGRC